MAVVPQFFALNLRDLDADADLLRLLHRIFECLLHSEREFRFGVGLKYPAHMAKRQWWHARDEIDPVNQPTGQCTQACIIACLKSLPANARHAERITALGGDRSPRATRAASAASAAPRLCDEERFL
jgi:hypothetical protein